MAEFRGCTFFFFGGRTTRAQAVAPPLVVRGMSFDPLWNRDGQLTACLPDRVSAPRPRFAQPGEVLLGRVDLIGALDHAAEDRLGHRAGQLRRDSQVLQDSPHPFGKLRAGSAGSVRWANTSIRPGHFGHCCTSIANTRLSSSAQLSLRRSTGCASATSFGASTGAAAVPSADGSAALVLGARTTLGLGQSTTLRRRLATWRWRRPRATRARPALPLGRSGTQRRTPPMRPASASATEEFPTELPSRRGFCRRSSSPGPM